MKFIHYVEKISGVDIYGLFSLLLFVTFFVVTLIWTYKTKKSSFNKISRIPLDEQEPK